MYTLWLDVPTTIASSSLAEERFICFFFYFLFFLFSYLLAHFPSWKPLSSLLLFDSFTAHIAFFVSIFLIRFYMAPNVT